MVSHVSLGTFNVTSQMRSFVNQVLSSGRLSYGPFSRRFEQDFARLHSCKYGVLSNSGTSSLLIALQSLKELHGWQDGDEVIVPAVTFVATINVVLQCRLKPVLVDVDPKFYDIVPGKIESAIWSKTRCIIPVHLFGQPADIGEIYSSISGSQKIIEDSCEAMFVNRYSDPVGSWGDISSFSFYMAHHLPMGVGGISLTDSPDYAKKMRSLVNHGLAYDDLSAGNDYDPSMLSRKFKFDSVGHSFRITELESALGLAQLETWQEMIASRQQNADYLVRNLRKEGLEERLQLPATRPNSEHSWMVFPLVCRQSGIRNDLMRRLTQKGIENRTMLPLTNQPVYRDLFCEDDYPIAKWINDNGFYIGCHQDLGKKELDYIVDELRGFFNERSRK